MSEVVRPSELADWLIAHGRHFITTDDVAKLTGNSPTSVRQSLRRPRAAHKIVSVTPGAWVPVPPEYRRFGAPPPAHFIDQLMNFLGHPYYVGFLSAAALHGASHQAAMGFHIVTTARLRSRTIGTSQLRFTQRSSVPARPTTQHLVPTGRMTVSTPTITVLDLVEAPHHGGGLSNVATVIAQFLEDQLINPTELTAAAATYPTAVIQRTGYLIDLVSQMTEIPIDLTALEHHVAAALPVPLATHRAPTGNHNNRWNVVANITIEPDL